MNLKRSQQVKWVEITAKRVIGMDLEEAGEAKEVLIPVAEISTQEVAIITEISHQEAVAATETTT